MYKKAYLALHKYRCKKIMSKSIIFVRSVTCNTIQIYIYLYILSVPVSTDVKIKKNRCQYRKKTFKKSLPAVQMFNLPGSSDVHEKELSDSTDVKHSKLTYLPDSEDVQIKQIYLAVRKLSGSTVVHMFRAIYLAIQMYK